MKFIKPQLVVGLFLLITTLSYSQTKANFEKIENKTKSYFNLNRENFYLHFNKSIYINTETIYFKGYVYDKTNENINIETTNVHVDFYTADGTKLASKLLYSAGGEFEGFFELKNNLPSQYYYFQVYTNWTNNFSEDESGVFSVEIINPDTGRYAYNDDNPIIQIFPDGGSFISNMPNTVGVSILDCHNKGIGITNGQITDSKGEQITTFQTNEVGFGKFQIIPETTQIYTVKFDLNGKTITTTLPKPIAEGTVLKVIDYMNESKTFVTVESSQNYRDKDKEHYLAVSQNNKVATINFNLTDGKKDIVLADSLLFNGVNIIRVLDSNLKMLNERIIYNYNKNTFISNWNVISKAKDSIKLNTSLVQNSKLSISVLPSESIATNVTTTMANSFLIDAYIEGKIPNGNYYFTDVNRKKKYELDLFLMGQTSKYKWENMDVAPIQKYSFTKGLTLKGKINETLDDPTKYKVQMFSFASGINVETTLNEKNEFYFKNVVASDSLQMNFSLIKNGSKYKELNYFPQLLSDEKQFTKPFLGIKNNCVADAKAEQKITSSKDMPELREAIQLKAIEITAKKDPKESKRKADYGNFNLKGKKITTDIYNAYRYIIPYIQSQGFDAGVLNGTVYIRGRTVTSFTKANIPAVFIDDVQLYDFDILNFYSLEQVDEILINKYATGVQSQGFGLIKIYTKKDFKSKSTFKSKSKGFIIKNGFAYEKPYENPDYLSTQTEGFKKYGTVDWKPFIDYSNKLVTIEFPKLQQKEFKLQIEGIAEDGKFISEIKTITIE